ncbi:MAG TPA: SH3 domain-containing protein [Candidatus Magasanikbacteria bacterium]|nr:SH3 domain-containing protein [Candidatus Magasanikbacteria bacterium]
MKKIPLLYVAAVISLLSPFQAHAETWNPSAPPEYVPINWVSGTGIKSFINVPENSGYIDYLTIIHLPSAEVKLITSDTPRTLKGPATAPFPEDTAENWSFAKSIVETFKAENPQVKFLWNAPFFNINIPVTELSLGLKSSDAEGAYITSGSRPTSDIEQPRRMLIIDNALGVAKITDFDENIFVKEGDQAVEGFHPLGSPSVKSEQTSRVYLGVRSEGKELLVFCSKSASHEWASEALLNAGVPLENQMQADGGGSATCAYNLPGQYFVEPGRTLPHVMGVLPKLPKGITTIDKLNVRSGPATSNKAIKNLPVGTSVTIYEEKGGWYRISETGDEWVSAGYVKKSVALPYDATTTINQLNVRGGAGTTFTVTRKLPISTKIKVYEEKNGWVRIGESEWVSAQFIK